MNDYENRGVGSNPAMSTMSMFLKNNIRTWFIVFQLILLLSIKIGVVYRSLVQW